jgi:hypothetical protein
MKARGAAPLFGEGMSCSATPWISASDSKSGGIRRSLKPAGQSGAQFDTEWIADVGMDCRLMVDG